MCCALQFEPTWASLQQYRCPEWFRDAKFSIYAHWGPYSAARGSRNTDWYSRTMYQKGHPNHGDHQRNHGPVEKVGYKDLVPLFTAENFNADEWVDLYVQAGARFAGPVAEHTDGFAMWDSRITPWNARAMGPKRDVVGEMERAVRRRGLKFVTSLHHQWKWGWYPVTNYKPDLLWFDNRMQILPEGTRREMVAFYFNQAARWEQPVVLNEKPPRQHRRFACADRRAFLTSLDRGLIPLAEYSPWVLIA